MVEGDATRLQMQQLRNRPSIRSVEGKTIQPQEIVEKPPIWQVHRIPSETRQLFQLML
jgi:hypothetical protein